MITQKHACPCCKFPTLDSIGDYEICTICWWEDDGQSVKDADKVYGGPNYQYSLTVACKNFAHHGHMYDEGKGIEVVENPSVQRKAMLAYLESVAKDVTRTDLVRLKKLVDSTNQQRRSD